MTQLPDARTVTTTIDATLEWIDNHAPSAFVWSYERERPQLEKLYNKGVSSQWNSVTDLDWSIDVDPEALVLDAEKPNMFIAMARAAAEIEGSPFKSWGDKEYTQLGIEGYKAQLSQFMHGEQGAMLAAAKIVETVPWIDAKYYAATQTIDEARHTEVFGKYVHTKLGEAYPMNPRLQSQVFDLVEDSRWDITYLGMQIIIESLALAAFGTILDDIREPLLRKLLRYVMADEARHVAFGVISLKEFYENLSASELKDRQEFIAENTVRAQARSIYPQMWERLGIDIEKELPVLMEAAGKNGGDLRVAFTKGFYSKLVPNVRKLGLLDANDGYLRKLWAEAGLLEYEFAEDTSSNYETYDAVDGDRVAAE